ncbi:hypothetical protein V7S57_17615 [Caulobacter sp. CCNWLY153]|uniref:hypothetical protein n=1 Tax=unclassified Caulobacter TaxID=2648921 RepID=UPI002FF20E61
MFERNLGPQRRRPPRHVGEVRVEGKRLPPWPLRLLFAAAVVSPLASSWYRAEHKAGLEARAEEAVRWSLDGDPCPVIAAADFAAVSRRAPMTTAFDEARLSRRIGHAQCSRHVYRLDGRKREAQVCDFTGPGALAVETPKALAYWAPPAAARVAIFDGQPRCVQRAVFRMGE